MPVSPAAAQSDAPMTDLVTAGDDYELLFTLPEAHAAALRDQYADPKVENKAIKKFRDYCRGNAIDLPTKGWQHR